MMAIYTTPPRKRSPEYKGADINFVADYEAVPGDTHIWIILRSDKETYSLTRPIESYPSILKWARDITPYLEHPVEIVPITEQEFADAQRRQASDRWPSLLLKPE